MTDDSEDAIKSSMVGLNRFPSAPTCDVHILLEGVCSSASSEKTMRQACRAYTTGSEAGSLLSAMGGDLEEILGRASQGGDASEDASSEAL